MLKNKFYKFLLIASSIWICIITFFYYFALQFSTTGFASGVIKSYIHLIPQLNFQSSHLYYIKAMSTLITFAGDEQKVINPNPLFSLVVILLCAYALFRIFLNHRTKKKFELTFPPVVFMMVILLFVYAVFQLWSVYFGLHDSIKYHGFFWQAGTIFGEILLIFLPILALGLKIVKLISKNIAANILTFLLSIGFGIGGIIFLLFGLALFGRLNQIYLAISLGIIIIICFKETWFCLKGLFATGIKLRFDGAGPTLTLIIITLITFAQNLLEVWRPLPVGHDDLEQYMNTTKLIAANHGLTPVDGFFYPWELFRTIPIILFHTFTGSMILSSLSGILSFLAVYILVKLYCRKRQIIFNKQENFYPLLAATFFYTLPSMVFQTSVDMKVDMASFFFGVLSLILILIWQEKPKEKILALFGAAFLAGMAFAIKISSIFSIVAIFILILFVLFRKKISLKLSAGAIIFSVVCFVLPMSPFAIRNIYQNISHRSELATADIHKSWSNIVLTNYYIPPQLTTEKSAAINHVDQILNKNNALEIDRYFGTRKPAIINFIFLPFTETFNLLVRGQYVDNGFIFLAFLPLVLIILPWIRRKNPNNPALLYGSLSGGIIAWTIWLFTAHGIVWYGLLGFAFLLPLLIEFIEFVRTDGGVLLKTLVTAALVIWFSSALILRFTVHPEYLKTIDAGSVAYIRGNLSDEDAKNLFIPDYVDLAKLNTAIAAANDPAHNKVYLIGKYLKYFIDQNNEIVLQDQFQNFAKIYQEKNDALTIERFKAAGFKYIVISVNQAPNFDTPEGQEMNTWRDEGTKFVLNNPDKIKILNNYQISGVIIAQIL